METRREWKGTEAPSKWSAGDKRPAADHETLENPQNAKLQKILVRFASPNQELLSGPSFRAEVQVPRRALTIRLSRRGSVRSGRLGDAKSGQVPSILTVCSDFDTVP